MVTRSQAAAITASARSSHGCPPHSKKALSVPMRELLPPARTNAARVCRLDGIWKSKSRKPRHTKVTYSECSTHRKMEMSDSYGALLVSMPQLVMDVLMLGGCSHEGA